MKGIMKSKKLIGLALILGLIISVFPLSMVAAASLTSTSDSLNPDTISTVSIHTIVFTTTTSIPTTGTIEITFPTGFTTVSSIVDADAAETLTAGSATFASSGQVVTGTVAGATVTAGVQTIVVGGTNKITNPATAGTYIVNIKTKNGSGTVLDSGYALAQVGSGKAASVSVKTYISSTITDNGSSGLSFGELDPGATDIAEAAQGGTGAITVTVGTEVNAIVKVATKAAGAWSDGGNTFVVGSGTYYNSNSTASDVAMTTSYQQVGSNIAAGAGGTMQVYHWLSIPNGQAAGAYSNTYYYKVDTAL